MNKQVVITRAVVVASDKKEDVIFLDINLPTTFPGTPYVCTAMLKARAGYGKPWVRRNLGEKALELPEAEDGTRDLTGVGRNILEQMIHDLRRSEKRLLLELEDTRIVAQSEKQARLELEQKLAPPAESKEEVLR